MPVSNHKHNNKKYNRRNNLAIVPKLGKKTKSHRNIYSYIITQGNTQAANKVTNLSERSFFGQPIVSSKPQIIVN